jgi:hypothetical protein
MNDAGSSNYELTVALGTELAASLDDHDTLGRWMAHYIADLIRQADEAPEGPEREALRHACATEILRLWSHRRSFGRASRPMISFDAVYRALERLDPQRPRWTDFRAFDDDPAYAQDGTKTAALLAAAIAVEDTARDTVRGLVLSASRAASQKEAKWVELAREVHDDESTFRQQLEGLLHGVAGGEAEMSPDEKQAAATVKAIGALAEAARRAKTAMDRSDAADS